MLYMFVSNNILRKDPKIIIPLCGNLAMTTHMLCRTDIIL